MPVFTVTYRPETGLAPETVEAHTVRVEADAQVVLRRTVWVIGQPRDIVVRRLPGTHVLSVEQADAADGGPLP